MILNEVVSWLNHGRSWPCGHFISIKTMLFVLMSIFMNYSYLDLPWVDFGSRNFVSWEVWMQILAARYPVARKWSISGSVSVATVRIKSIVVRRFYTDPRLRWVFGKWWIHPQPVKLESGRWEYKYSETVSHDWSHELGIGWTTRTWHALKCGLRLENLCFLYESSLLSRIFRCITDGLIEVVHELIKHLLRFCRVQQVPQQNRHLSAFLPSLSISAKVSGLILVHVTQILSYLVPSVFLSLEAAQDKYLLAIQLFSHLLVIFLLLSMLPIAG